MKITILPSAPGASAPRHYLSTYLIDERAAVDAGCLGLWETPARQADITDVFLTHSHADHLATLPVFLENSHGFRAAAGGGDLVVHGSAAVLEALRTHVFNDVIWPRLDRFIDEGRAYFRMEELRAEEPVRAAGLTVTPVPVHHVVPTMGLIVDDGEAAVVFGGDSGPTDRLWQAAGALPHLRAAFLEATFPDEMAELAGVTGHLTPETLLAEAAKLPDRVTVVATHLRTRHRDRVVAQLEARSRPGLLIGEPGREYRF